ncbi:hypothetical protein RICGR_1183 [Rickettsiella grylli]|uniref:Uncharacterized protein n=1 Tax=Rickettsiella grylli TaxID=59196 RepID=A8PP24_9COXI|nr:hypothetical protein RICGR_1183 [Rickettsiella grylli]
MWVLQKEIINQLKKDNKIPIYFIEHEHYKFNLFKPKK